MRRTQNHRHGENQIDQSIKGVIFDLDGTLVSSSLNFAEIRNSIGCPQEQDILRFVTKLNVQERARAEQCIIDFEMQDAHQAKVLPGVLNMLQCLRDWQIPTAIVTRNCVQASKLKLRNCGLQFDILLTRECAPAKPNPKALLDIASQWQIGTDNLIYVGDYLHDINAAKNAGMRSVFMAFKGMPEWGTSATWQFSDYQAFISVVDELRSSPPVKLKQSQLG